VQCCLVLLLVLLLLLHCRDAALAISLRQPPAVHLRLLTTSSTSLPPACQQALTHSPLPSCSHPSPCAPRPSTQAGSQLKGELRLAAPLAPPAGGALLRGPFCRAAFLLDYRDTGLFCTLEEVARKHNARLLGLLRETNRVVRPDRGAGEELQATAGAGGGATRGGGTEAGKVVRHAMFLLPGGGSQCAEAVGHLQASPADTCRAGDGPKMRSAECCAWQWPGFAISMRQQHV
jgi:hypothetical protein